jgi:hypothetical protein
MTEIGETQEDDTGEEAVGNLTLEEKQEKTTVVTTTAENEDEEEKPEKENELDVANIRYANVWNKDDENVQKGVMDLWDNQFGDGMTTEMKKKRLGSVCVVAYDGEQVIAVSTLVINPNKGLWCKIGYFRCMVRSNYRLKGVATQLAVECKQVLAEYSKIHPSENIKAFGTMVDGKHLGEKGRKPFWPKTGMTIIGYNELGMQFRIAWLDSARVEF